MFYTVKTPWWLKLWHPAALWSVPSSEKILYLSFDDGPHPEVTPFVLQCLAQYEAKATFFCIGRNVEMHPHIFRMVQEAGHGIGNHTFDHLNGWKTADAEYLDNIGKAGALMGNPNWFRPPYGRIRRRQGRLIRERFPEMQWVMWDVLSGDFDLALSPDKCADNVKRNAGPGSIVVFHDSEKAFPRLQIALPDILKYFHEQGYRFEGLPN